MSLYGVRDKGNQLIQWFSNEQEDTIYIKRMDPQGSKGYHLIRG